MRSASCAADRLPLPQRSVQMIAIGKLRGGSAGTPRSVFPDNAIGKRRSGSPLAPRLVVSWDREQRSGSTVASSSVRFEGSRSASCAAAGLVLPEGSLQVGALDELRGGLASGSRETAQTRSAVNDRSSRPRLIALPYLERFVGATLAAPSAMAELLRGG